MHKYTYSVSQTNWSGILKSRIFSIPMSLHKNSHICKNSTANHLTFGQQLLELTLVENDYEIQSGTSLKL